MESKEIEARLLEIVPSAEIDVSGADCDFSVTVVSDDFEGLNTMKRQQKILSGFSDLLTSGTLHALTVKAFTFDEWNKKTAESTGLVQLSL